jgi:hypothetical protein
VNLNTYIVRVYRSEEGIPHSLVGVVEEVGKKEKKAFTSLDDLWAILNSPREIAPRKRDPQKKAETGLSEV